MPEPTKPKFSWYTVENTITEESAKHGDYASTEIGDTKEGNLREAIDALNSNCWDNIDERGDGTIICYPADYTQNMRTGDYEGFQLIITARRPEWAEKLMEVWRVTNKSGRRY